MQQYAHTAYVQFISTPSTIIIIFLMAPRAAQRVSKLYRASIVHFAVSWHVADVVAIVVAVIVVIVIASSAAMSQPLGRRRRRRCGCHLLAAAEEEGGRKVTRWRCHTGRTGAWEHVGSEYKHGMSFLGFAKHLWHSWSLVSCSSTRRKKSHFLYHLSPISLLSLSCFVSFVFLQLRLCSSFYFFRCRYL